MPVLDVNENNFEKEVLNSKTPVLVDFYADWCGPCKIMGPMVDQVANEIGDDAKVVKINVDENKSLAMEYEVMTIPNFVVFKDGKKADSLVGVQTKESLTHIIKG